MTDTDFTDVRYDVDGAVAVVTIDRPERMNAFRSRTVDELIRAFRLAWADRTVGAVVLTGAGDRAFCAGGDMKQKFERGDYGPTDSGIYDIERLHQTIRAIPKPVIAAVNGVAIGGGHVLHVLCDLTIASETARFGQSGPRVGSFDAGFGTAYLARVVGEKRARQIWFLLEQYDAETAERWGLVNAVVPPEQLLPKALEWGRTIASYSPTAIRFLKHSFNADSENLIGIQSIAYAALDLYTQTAESHEGAAAFNEKRPPRFAEARDGTAIAALDDLAVAGEMGTE